MTRIVSAFPGTGKTFLFQNPGELTILDSDSSQFSWSEPGVRNPDFPANYIQHIKENLGKVDIIMVSSHKEVRDALVNEGLEFTLVFPFVHTKDEYVQRYVQRGSPQKFIDLVESQWANWILELYAQEGCSFIILDSGEYLSDRINEINIHTYAV